MKTKKRRLEFFSFYNHTGIENHLTDMAKKGWMIESISNFYWTYRKIEPTDIHFSVSYYPRASDFDPGPTEEQQTFHDFCAHTGWNLACTWFQMQVFYNEKESPIPLDTDPIMEVDTLHRACKKNFLPTHFIMFALSLLMTCYFFAGVYFNPIVLLSSSSRLVTQFAYVCLFLISSVELVTYFTWHRRAKKAAEDDIFVDTPSTVKFQSGIMVILLIGVVYWVVNLFAADDPLLAWMAIVMLAGMFTIMFLVNGIKQWLKKAKASRGMNKFLTLLACFLLPTIMTSIIIYGGIRMNRVMMIPENIEKDNIPLSVSDMMDVNEDFYVKTNDKHDTFFLGTMNVDAFIHWDYREHQDLPDLRYDITIVKMPWLYEWCKHEMFKDMDESDNKDIPVGHRLVLKEQDPSPWGANEVYRLYQEEGWYMNWYLLCYEDKIIDIRFDWEPTTDDMAIVNQKLNP